MSFLRESHSTLAALAQRYIAALNALDTDAFLTCFSINCVVRDPYGVSIYHGGDELRQYMLTMTRTWQALQLAPGAIYYGGDDRVVFSWAVQATAWNGRAAVFEGITVLTVKQDLIDGLESYYDAQVMFAQIQSEGG
ncbi:MAG: nuclear transport factor 2 family protein [Anaerolineae bacterium]|nr:nuclear transport factor 2 family protein [Anaerolineae bacterium]